jgi:peptidoglycan/xylan/chitin deacetylase (PgdA/CDA1 family)
MAWPMNRLALAALTNDSVTALLRPLTRGAACILTLHRFADPALGIEGHSASALRANLAYLRRHGHRLISLRRLAAELEEGRSPASRTVVFTVDDGYEDFARIAAPIFAEFDCPVHVFLTTGFVDRRLWLWWDRIEYILERTTQGGITLKLGHRPISLTWSDRRSRRDAAVELSESLKRCPESVKLAVIDTLAVQLEVPTPRQAPISYQPMTWDVVRALSQCGVGFGPHSVTHPIFSGLDDDQAEWEIVESWRRVRAEVPAALPVFCYPNGRPGDYTGREFALLRQSGLRLATTTDEGYVGPALLSEATPDDRYRLPRFGYPDDQRSLVRVVSGFERARNVVRAAMGR